MFIISKEVHQATTYDAAVTNVIHNFKAYKRNEAKKNYFFRIMWGMEKALLYGKMFALVVLYDGDNDYDFEEVKCIRVSS